MENEQDWKSLIKKVTRTLLNIQYRLATEQVVEQMKTGKIGNLDDENEILQAALNLTSNE